jgi:hypothetical protein
MSTIVVRLPDAAPARRDLTRPVVAGGSQADDLCLPGCPAAALRLVPCAAGVVVEAAARGVHAAGHRVRPGARRLLRPGEAVTLHGAVLEVAPSPALEETRAAAAALLRAAAAGAAPPAGLHLIVLTGPAAGARHALGTEQTVGRGRAATIVLPDASASRVHARLTVGPGGATIEDLRSKNGVRVNGVRIDRPAFPVRAGDELTVGETALALTDGAGTSSGGAAPEGRGGGGRLLTAALLAVSAVALALAAG